MIPQDVRLRIRPLEDDNADNCVKDEQQGEPPELNLAKGVSFDVDLDEVVLFLTSHFYLTYL